MSFNLYDAAKGMITDELLKKAAAYTGESEAGVSKAFKAILPALITGFADKASTHDGANTIANIAKSTYAAGAPNVADFFGNESGGLLNKGAGLLTSLFGEHKMNGLTELISSFSGVRNSSATSLLSMAAPMIMGLIGKHISTGNADANSIFSWFKTEKANVASMIPAGLGLSNLFGHSSVNTGNAGRHISQQTNKSGSGMKWLLPLLLLAVLAVAAFYLFGKGCNDKKADVVATDSLSSITGDATINDAKTTFVTAAGKLDSTTGDFIYDYGDTAVIDLPNNAGKLTIGKNSTEYKLINFLNDKNAELDTVKGNWFEFTNVHFKTGGAEITDASMQQLKNMVMITKAFPSAQFKFGGYTDSTGDADMNLVLSQKRADAVAAMVKKLGAAANAITGAKGYGKEWPIADNATPEGRAINRRVAVNVKAK